MLPLHDHNEAQMTAQIVARIRGGEAIALVSDAGTPLVSDPGYKLVRAAIEADLMVTHLPGASSVLTALVVSALPPDRFLFCGFLPPKSSERRSVLNSLARIPASLVFFESGPRLAESLSDLAGALGPRAASVSRELTKKFEETVRGPLDQLARDYATRGTPKGEIVVVVGPPPPIAAPDAQTLDAALLAALAEHSLAQAAASVADAFGIPKREAYERALALTGKKTIT
jgi:16S rRNA (cytidine1402-2'-O)-methyltransferase